MTHRQPIIAASLLPADFARLGDEVSAVAAGGADVIHLDVMDGVFVPNLTFGPDVVAAIRGRVNLPFEAHLMVTDPHPLLERWVDAGCDLVCVHAEVCPHLHRTLDSIRQLGVEAGVALNPSTPVDAVRHVLDVVDQVLVMTVNPGFGGQRYLPTMEPKITRLRELIDAGDRPVRLAVDGGVNADTAPGAARAGADALVAGSAIFRHGDGPRAGIHGLRAACEAEGVHA